MKLRLKTQRARLAAQKAAQAQKTASKRFFSTDDPDGSYTGVPADGGKPVQDADDL